MSVADTLKKARRLIASGEHWTSGCLAKTREGRWCDAKSSSAWTFCAIGAVLHVASDDDCSAASETRAHPPVAALHRAANRLYGIRSVADVNDGVGMTPDPDPKERHAAVLRVYDLAIEEASQLLDIDG